MLRILGLLVITVFLLTVDGCSRAPRFRFDRVSMIDGSLTISASTEFSNDKCNAYYLATERQTDGTLFSYFKKAPPGFESAATLIYSADDHLPHQTTIAPSDLPDLDDTRQYYLLAVDVIESESDRQARFLIWREIEITDVLFKGKTHRRPVESEDVMFTTIAVLFWVVLILVIVSAVWVFNMMLKSIRAPGPAKTTVDPPQMEE